MAKSLAGVLEALSSTDNPEEFSHAERLFHRQVDALGERDKARYWGFLAALKLEKHNDANGSLQLLRRVLRLPRLATEQKLETMARMAANRFAVGQYDEGLDFHQQALKLGERNHPNSIYIIMGIYLKQESFDVQCAEVSTVLSFLYEIHDRLSQAAKQEKKALAFFKAEGQRSLAQSRFSEWRLALLRDVATPKLSRADENEFINRNNALKKLFEFFPLAAAERSPEQLSNEKAEIIRKLRKTYMKYLKLNRPEFTEKLARLNQAIQQLSTSELPLIMSGEFDKLGGQDRPIEVPRLTLGSHISRTRLDDTYGRPPIPSTTSRILEVPAQHNDPNWEGSTLIKINFGSEGEDERYFYLRPGKERMYYAKNSQSKSKDDDYYSLQGLEAVKLGKLTKTLMKKEHNDKDQSLCFSLEFKDRTRDFVAPNRSDLSMWITRLKEILATIKSKRGGNKMAETTPPKYFEPKPQASQYASRLPMEATLPPERQQQKSQIQQESQMQRSQFGKGTVFLSKKR